MNTINPLLEKHINHDAVTFKELSKRFGIPADILIKKKSDTDFFTVQIEIVIPKEISDNITDTTLLMSLDHNSLTDFLLNSLSRSVRNANATTFAVVTTNLKNNIQEKIKHHKAFGGNSEVEVVIKFDDEFKERIKGLYSLDS